MKKLNKAFENLRLEDYLCSYTDNSAQCKYKKPSESELSVVYESMKKHTKAEKETNSITETVDAVNRRTEELASAAEEISASTDIIIGTLDNIKRDLSVVVNTTQNGKN